jgi:hypothetical protein
MSSFFKMMGVFSSILHINAAVTLWPGVTSPPLGQTTKQKLQHNIPWPALQTSNQICTTELSAAIVGHMTKQPRVACMY